MPCTVTFFLTVLRLIPRSLGRVSTAIPNSPPAQERRGHCSARRVVERADRRLRTVPALRLPRRSCGCRVEAGEFTTRCSQFRSRLTTRPRAGLTVPVPILKQRDYLIASIQAALNDEDLKKLREALVAQVGEFRSRGVR